MQNSDRTDFLSRSPDDQSLGESLQKNTKDWTTIMRGRINERITSATFGRADKEVREISDLESILKDIAALDGQTYRQLLAFLQRLRDKDIVYFSVEIPAFLEGKEYPPALHAVLDKIRTASRAATVRRFGRHNNLALELLLWSRTMRQGCNIRNPQEEPAIPSTFPLQRRLRIWVEGTHGGEHYRGDQMEIRHYEDFSRLHYKGKVFTIPADGRLVVIGQPYRHHTLFGHELGEVVAPPNIPLDSPYSRIGLQARRDRNGFSFYQNGSLLPVQYDDGEEAGRFEDVVVENPHDGTLALGQSIGCPSMGPARTMVNDDADMPPELSAPRDEPDTNESLVHRPHLPDARGPKPEPEPPAPRRNRWQRGWDFLLRRKRK